MHQKHLLRFIKSKLRKEPDEVVIFRDGKYLTLKEVRVRAARLGILVGVLAVGVTALSIAALCARPAHVTCAALAGTALSACSLSAAGPAVTAAWRLRAAGV